MDYIGYLFIIISNKLGFLLNKYILLSNFNISKNVNIAKIHINMGANSQKTNSLEIDFSSDYTTIKTDHFGQILEHK